MIKSFNRILILSKRNLKEIIRDPISLIFIIGLPLIMEILFYSIFHNMTSQFEMKYLAPGIVVFSQTFLTLFIGQIISVDKNTSFLTRLYVSKAKPCEFIISYVFSLIPLVLIQNLLFFLIGVLFDSSLFKVEIIFCMLLSIITSLFYLFVGVLFGSLFNEKSVNGVSSIIISAHSVLSGMWFPIEGLSGVMVRIMNFLPFKNTTVLIQNTLNGYNNLYNDLVKPLIIVLIYLVLTFILAIFTFKKQMKEN